MDELNYDEAFARLTQDLLDIPDPALGISAAELADTASVFSEAAQMITCFLGVILSLGPDEKGPTFPDEAIPIIQSVTKTCETLSDLIHGAICACDEEDSESDGEDAED